MRLALSGYFGGIRAPSLGNVTDQQIGADEQVRRLECLSCEKRTDHRRGPVTLGADGAVLVQWWACLECEDGHTVA